LSKYLDIKTHVKSHFICDDCSTINDIASTNCIKCNSSEIIQFDSYDIKPQLDQIISNDSFLNQIKKSNNRRNENKISELLSALGGDIYSGIKIKNDETLISLNINTDGAP
jgi:predicted ATP-dependent serine protease